MRLHCAVKNLLPMKSSLRLPLWGTGRGKLCEVETRLSRPTSAARLLPTISSPSLEDEGRNPVACNDAARAARFAWMFATHADRPAWDQSNCVTACLARTLQRLRSGERSGRSAAGVPGGFTGATDAPVIDSLCAFGEHWRGFERVGNERCGDRTVHLISVPRGGQAGKGRATRGRYGLTPSRSPAGRKSRRQSETMNKRVLVLIALSAMLRLRAARRTRRTPARSTGIPRA